MMVVALILFIFAALCNADEPSVNNQLCIVSADIDDCKPLLDTIEFEDGCDCHNFCGDRYIGCCSFSSFCQLTCQTEKFVAGCVFPSLSSAPTLMTTTSPTSVPKDVETNSPTNLATTKVSDIANNNPTTTEPIMVTTTPTPFSPSPIENGMCLLVANEDECDILMQNVEPRDECDCYNFCNGIELDCCGFSGNCPIVSNCVGGFVAGCIVDQSTPDPTTPDPTTPNPTTPNPTTPNPTSSPTLQPQCYMQVNKQKCSKYTSNQSPKEVCDCYNYCDGELVGCVPYNIFAQIDCIGDLVAGCELESEEKCLLSVNTGECDPLMENGKFLSYMDDDRDCDCYNFCGDGTFYGCCGYNEFCGYKCEQKPSVLGCTIDNNIALTRAKSSVMNSGVPTDEGFYSPDIWPDGFWPNGYAAQKDSPVDNTQNLRNTVSNEDGKEIVI